VEPVFFFDRILDRLIVRLPAAKALDEAPQEFPYEDAAAPTDGWRNPGPAWLVREGRMSEIRASLSAKLSRSAR
jgi:hypothetical protein